MTHVVADAYNASGVPLLWPAAPLSTRVSLARIRLGSPQEELLDVAAWTVALVGFAARVPAYLRLLGM